MAGNWKMYKTPAETRLFFDKFNSLVAASHHCEILICPPAVDLTTAVDSTRGTNVMIGAMEEGLDFARALKEAQDSQHLRMRALSARRMSLNHSGRFGR